MPLPLVAIINWQEVTGWLALAYLALSAGTVFWILWLKRDSTAAVAWCLTVIFIPYIGILLFVFFGYQSVHRPIRRKRRHAAAYKVRVERSDGTVRPVTVEPAAGWQGVSELAQSLGADPLLPGNRVDLYYDGRAAYDAMFAAIAQAQHHVHMQMFIFRYDDIGKKFIDALAERASAGVQVRFLYDAVGSWRLRRRMFAALCEAGGYAEPFLPVKLFRRRLQINLRNHRKTVIVDGKVGFTGGLNVGGEYLGLDPFFGPWRDTFLRLEGPSVASLQRLFLEDWDFSAADTARDQSFFPPVTKAGDAEVQVIWSGPDQELKIIREVYFAAITRAKSRIWIATPYFVPDVGLFDALCLAARSGLDVRLLCPFRPDKWVPFLAARYYWNELLTAGMKIYQYTAGFMHAKVLLIDDEWASIGTTNFDNRSLRLNFELTCLIESSDVVRELEAQFLRDFAISIRVDRDRFMERPFVGRMAENASRLLSPLL